MDPDQILKDCPHLSEDVLLELLTAAVRAGMCQDMFRLMLVPPADQEAFLKRTKEAPKTPKGIPSIRLKNMDGYNYALIETRDGKDKQIMADIFGHALSAAESWLRQEMGILT